MNSETLDLIVRIKAELASAGLVLDGEPDCSGELACCGTARKPGGKDGRYVVHFDFPPSVWVCNYHESGEGQTILLWSKGQLAAMPKSERKALQARIAKEREDAKARKAERQAEAAAKAAEILSGCADAGDSNGYLFRKGVHAVSGLKQNASGHLVVPVLDEKGELASLQFIMPEKPSEGSDKRFLVGGQTAGGYFPIPARDGGKDAPLLICEGLATGLSLHEATGFPVLTAFNSGNLEAVAKMARRLYPARDLVIGADNDIRKPGDACQVNTGVEAATRAASAVGAKLAICPAHEGRKTDFNDLHLWESLERVRQVVRKALDNNEGVTYPAGYSVRFSGKEPGIYRNEKRGEDSDWIRIAPPLTILGRTKSVGSDNWGTLMQWNDPAGKEHLYALPDDVMQRQNNDWAAALAYNGYSIRRGKANAFAVFIQELKTKKFVTCTNSVGWHGTAYVLPDTVYGADRGTLVLQGGGHEGLYTTSGTREAWEELARLCTGNSRLVFALCAAFAGPLLRLADVEGGGFSFEGGSSCGKTTCLQVAASVWGSPAHMRPWRATDNGLEGVCVLHNDNLLILDEVGQVSAQTLSECGYLIANGMGKTRSGKDSALRKSHTWRLLFLSSGEIGFAEKLSEKGLKARAGQEVRFVGIPTDAGMLSDLHGLSDAGAVSNRLKELAGQHYGHAGRAFLQWLTDNRQDVADGVGESLATGVSRLSPPDATEQVLRVARRFALVSYAGKAAQLAGVLPADMNVSEAVRSCFNDWLAARGGAGSGEDAVIVGQVRRILERDGGSRFQPTADRTGRWIDRLGFSEEQGNGETRFYVLPEQFKSEMIKGFCLRTAVAALQQAGILHRGTDRVTVKKRVPGLGSTWCYELALPFSEGETL